MNVGELLEECRELKTTEDKRERLRDTEIEVAGSVGNVAYHASRMGVVCYFNSEGHPDGVTADWFQSSGNGYSEADVATVCFAFVAGWRGV